MKPVHWVGSTREEVRSFPKEVRREIGFALEAAQQGDKHPSATPLRGFGGAGVLEVVESKEPPRKRGGFNNKEPTHSKSPMQAWGYRP